jgi:hypothetical protein
VADRAGTESRTPDVAVLVRFAYATDSAPPRIFIVSRWLLVGDLHHNSTYCTSRIQAVQDLCALGAFRTSSALLFPQYFVSFP